MHSMTKPPEKADSPEHLFEFEHKFDFDLDRAISAQVVGKLEMSPLIRLERNAAPKVSGVYALYYKGRLVYFGKASKGTTKSERSLRERLNEHATKINGRQHIRLSQMSFRYLTFESEWWVFAAEYALMVHYEPEWNTSGFGSKTPGKGRPGTERVSPWNRLFPPKVP